MPPKKKSKKTQTRSKKATVKKVKPKKRPISKTKSAKKSSRKKVAVKTKAMAKKVVRAKASRPPKRRVRARNPTTTDTAAFLAGRSTPRSGGQSGDFQGLSNFERADSESVDELLEEGNAFEAGVVAGVEEAGSADEREVHTHEVPEDDVPTEYLEKD